MALRPPPAAPAAPAAQDLIKEVHAQLSPAPRPDIKAKLVAEIKAKQQEERNISFDVLGDTTGIHSIHSALAYLRNLLEKEEVPLTLFEISLRETMKLLKKYDGTILELEPEDIKMIVQGYMSLADAELQSIFSKPAAKERKVKDKGVQDLLKAAKEIGQGNLSDFNVDDMF